MDNNHFTCQKPMSPNEPEKPFTSVEEEQIVEWTRWPIVYTPMPEGISSLPRLKKWTEKKITHTYILSGNLILQDCLSGLLERSYCCERCMRLGRIVIGLSGYRNVSLEVLRACLHIVQGQFCNPITGKKRLVQTGMCKQSKVNLLPTHSSFTP